jgi:hypothetical protein
VFIADILVPGSLIRIGRSTRLPTPPLRGVHHVPNDAVSV